MLVIRRFEYERTNGVFYRECLTKATAKTYFHKDPSPGARLFS